LNSEVTHNEEDPLSKNQDVDGLPEDMLHEVYDRATEVSAISFKVFPRLFISSHLWFSLFVRKEELVQLIFHLVDSIIKYIILMFLLVLKDSLILMLIIIFGNSLWITLIERFAMRS
jgi:hypothetical protein